MSHYLSLSFAAYECKQIEGDKLSKIEKGKWGMCQSDNNPTIEQTTADGHQWVFNVARNFRTRRTAHLAYTDI